MNHSISRGRTHLVICSVIVALALWLAAPPAAAAGPILIPTGSQGIYQMAAFDPIGQSFTALDPFVTAGLFFSAINPGHPNTDLIVYNLWAGDGTSGALLASSTFSLATGFVGFHMVNFSSVALTIGSVYSLTASVLGSSPHWGIHAGNFPSSYAGGNGIMRGSPLSGPLGFDFALSVTPVAVVSEPASILLAVVGLAGLEAKRRRAKTEK